MGRVGQGEFDNLGQIRALLQDGYKGTFTLETHWRDRRASYTPPKRPSKAF